jgi:hypothetical protein
MLCSHDSSGRACFHIMVLSFAVVVIDGATRGGRAKFHQLQLGSPVQKHDASQNALTPHAASRLSMRIGSLRIRTPVA